MDKQEFLKQLEEALDTLGVLQAKAVKYLNKFESIIDEAPAEQQAETIAKLGSPAEVAEKIKSANEQREESKKQEEPAVEENSAQELPQAAPNTPASNSAEISSEFKPVKAEKQSGEIALVKKKKEKSKSEATEERETVMSERGKRIFLIGVIATSPITLAIILALAVVFLALYVVTVIVSGVLVLVEIIGVIGGVLLGVTGILYGIIGILPGDIPTYVGMYELGYGLVILGIVTVVGILVYEYIMKGTPLICKGITMLIKFTAKKYKQLFLFIRKECGKL